MPSVFLGALPLSYIPIKVGTVGFEPTTTRSICDNRYASDPNQTKEALDIVTLLGSVDRCSAS